MIQQEMKLLHGQYQKQHNRLEQTTKIL